MKFRDYLYIILMLLFMIMAYLFFDRGFNVKTKEIVHYQEKSDLIYKVYLQKNDEFDTEYLKMDERYITSLVDKINFEFTYNNLFDKDVNGYYSYYVVGTLHAYLNDINESIWEKDYTLLDNKTEVINKNNVRNIEVLDRFSVDFSKYRNELANFSKKYGLELAGYLEVKIIVKENINFFGVSKIITDDNLILVNIPLTYDTFRITTNNDNNKIDSYYDFNKRNKVNYLLLIVAAFMLSMGISFLALVIRKMVFLNDDKARYIRELKRILREHDEKIVKIKRFYNKKKYNLIYVTSFDELLDVYNKVRTPISFREIKKNEEAMFILIDLDNAWIYQLKVAKK